MGGLTAPFFMRRADQPWSPYRHHQIRTRS